MRILTVPACLMLMAASPLHSQAPPPATPSPLHWSSAPAVFPPGAKIAVLSGDPAKAAPFTVELAFPAGYKVAPHFHPTAETVTVKRGTLLVGMGDTFDASKAKPMQVGDSGSIPANAHHFAAAKGATFITVSAMGPFALTYVHAADDPQKAATKP
ncbi:MAG TPA: cupin domain-containing protein [Gemmatimonadales bacterium]